MVARVGYLAHIANNSKALSGTTLLLTTHVDVATLHEDEYGQSGENNETQEKLRDLAPT